nr:MAG: hypothetical protein 2 [Leviviridae sp.]
MGANSGAFSKDDGSYKLNFSHSLQGGFNQRLVRLDRRQTVADPLTTGEFYETTDSVWLVSRTPKAGVSLAAQKQLIDGYLAWLTASSGAAITKLLAGES